MRPLKQVIFQKLSLINDKKGYIPSDLGGHDFKS